MAIHSLVEFLSGLAYILLAALFAGRRCPNFSNNLTLNDSRQTRDSVRSRVLATGQKSRQSVTDIANAVSSAERWLKSKDETRDIELIPPTELDAYLTEFYTVIRKQNGSDYEQASFKNLRSYLDRFLRENGYPVSISRSVEFSRSTMAYKSRRSSLQPSSRNSNFFNDLAKTGPMYLYDLDQV